MRVPALIGIPLTVLVAFVCGKQVLYHSCTNQNGTVYITLNNDNSNQFIIVPCCNDSNVVGSKYTLSHCLESFTNGTHPGYLFHETGHNSEVRSFKIDCKNRSNGNASVSMDGNMGYYLGQEIKVTLKSAGPYSITPVKCIASSSVNPDISIVLWENGTTQRQYLLTNFSDTCNDTLIATMYGFRFVHSTGVSLTCSVRPCVENEPDEPLYTDDTDFPDQAWYSEDDDYLGLLTQLTRTVTLNII